MGKSYSITFTRMLPPQVSEFEGGAAEVAEQAGWRGGGVVEGSLTTAAGRA